MSRIFSATAALAAIGLVISLSACSKPAATANTDAPVEAAPETPAANPVANHAESAAPALDSDDIKVTAVDGPGFEAALEKHLGKVVLVDFWATWCEPCRENFPHIVKLSQQHADKGLAVVSLSIDEPGSDVAIRKFLADQGADFEHFVSKFGAGTETTESFDIRGDVPFYRLYDRLGILRYQFTDLDPQDVTHGESMDMMDERVKELLGEASGE